MMKVNVPFSPPPADSTLEVAPLGPVDTAEAAWALLQTERFGGWVTFPDAVAILDPKGARPAPRPFLQAEVAHGPESIHVRFDGARWVGWRYVKRPGQTHVTETVAWLAVEGASVTPPASHLVYERFWALAPDPVQPDLSVWTPVAARFCGFKDAQEDAR
jgi:hypothetical protein